MYKLIVCAIGALLVSAPPVAAQTNPCNATPTTAYNPTKVAAQIPNYAEVLPNTNSPRIVDWQLGVFNSGVDPATGAPVSVLTIPRVSFQLVPGTPDCYEATLAELLAVPVGAVQVGAMRAREANGVAGPWSAGSNPFARLPALTPPSAVRLIP